MENKLINSIEISKMINTTHSGLMRSIRGFLIETNGKYFIKSYYINLQNKKQPCYNITLEGIKYIIDHKRKTPSLNKLIKYYNKYSINNKVQPIILNERYEIKFGQVINKMFNGILNFTSQYNCCNNKYRIDFYCP